MYRADPAPTSAAAIVKSISDREGISKVLTRMNGVETYGTSEVTQLDRLHEQVSVLTRKVDALHDAIGRLDRRLSVGLSNLFPEPSPAILSDARAASNAAETTLSTADRLRDRHPAIRSEPDYPAPGSPDFPTANPHPVAENHLGAERTGWHKDILIDDDYSESNPVRPEPTLTPEVQVQRLMAQLTAAYNRMADLEEQLLALRSQ